MNIGQKLRSYRLSLDVTQGNFAKSLGVSQSFYSAVEKGIKHPSDKFLQKIKEVYAKDLVSNNDNYSSLNN